MRSVTCAVKFNFDARNLKYSASGGNYSDEILSDLPVLETLSATQAAMRDLQTKLCPPVITGDAEKEDACLFVKLDTAKQAGYTHRVSGMGVTVDTALRFGCTVETLQQEFGEWVRKMAAKHPIYANQSQTITEKDI